MVWSLNYWKAHLLKLNKGQNIRINLPNDWATKVKKLLFSLNGPSRDNPCPSWWSLMAWSISCMSLELIDSLTWPSSSTMDHGGCHNPTFPNSLVFLHCFSVYMQFRPFFCYSFVFKGYFWLQMKDLSSSPYNPSKENSIRDLIWEIGRRRNKIKWKQRLGSISKDLHSSIWISNFLILFSFNFLLLVLI